MARHHPDLQLCRKPPGVVAGRLCSACDGKCVICESYATMSEVAKICDECNYGSLHDRCISCGNRGVADAYYCRECVLLEKDRDGCPRVINLGSTKKDQYHERRALSGGTAS